MGILRWFTAQKFSVLDVVFLIWAALTYHDGHVLIATFTAVLGITLSIVIEDSVARHNARSRERDSE